MLDVETDVIIESPAMRIRIEDNGSTIVARFNGPFDPIGAIRQGSGFLALVRQVVPWLTRAGLTFELVVGGLRVARAGAEADGVARLLNVANVHLGG